MQDLSDEPSAHQQEGFDSGRPNEPPEATISQVFLRQAEIAPTRERDERFVQMLVADGSIPVLSSQVNRFKTEAFDLHRQFPDLRELADIHPQRQKLAALHRKMRLYEEAIRRLAAFKRGDIEVETAASARTVSVEDLTEGNAGGEPEEGCPVVAASQPADVPTASEDNSSRRAERKKLRDDYIAECKRAGVKVTDVMIAQDANPRTPNHKGWNTRDAVQKWLQCDPKYDGQPDRMIRAVFDKKPHLPKANPTPTQL